MKSKMLVAALAAAVIVVGGAVLYSTVPEWLAATEPKVIDPEIERIINARKNGYQEMGAAFKLVQDELKSAAPLASMLSRATGQVLQYAKQQVDLFPPGSGPESGIETDARKEIWTNYPDFERRLNELVSASEQLASAAAGAPSEAFAQQVEIVGEICKQCHRRYRNEK